jgi:hypothetical protein
VHRVVVVAGHRHAVHYVDGRRRRRPPADPVADGVGETGRAGEVGRRREVEVTVGVRRDQSFQARHVEHGDAQGVAVRIAVVAQQSRCRDVERLVRTDRVGIGNGDRVAVGHVDGDRRRAVAAETVADGVAETGRADEAGRRGKAEVTVGVRRECPPQSADVDHGDAQGVTVGIAVVGQQPRRADVECPAGVHRVVVVAGHRHAVHYVDGRRRRRPPADPVADGVGETGRAGEVGRRREVEVAVGVRRDHPFQARHVEHRDAQGVAVRIAVVAQQSRCRDVERLVRSDRVGIGNGNRVAVGDNETQCDRVGNRKPLPSRISVTCRDHEPGRRGGAQLAIDLHECSFRSCDRNLPANTTGFDLKANSLPKLSTHCISCVSHLSCIGGVRFFDRIPVTGHSLLNPNVSAVLPCHFVGNGSAAAPDWRAFSASP